MPHGKLTVVMEGATDIKSSRLYGRGGSFCTLACGSQNFNSPSSVEGGSYPLFKTMFEFEIDSNTNELNVCVYSEGSTSRDDELVGFCTLKFKKVFFFGHTVPLTAYPIQQPSENPGGTVNISFKFKMWPSPNRNNTHAPMRSSPPPRGTHNMVSRQSLSVDWGYGCHEEDAPEAKSYRRTQSDPPRHQDSYQYLHGTASDNPKRLLHTTITRATLICLERLLSMTTRLSPPSSDMVILLDVVQKSVLKLRIMHAPAH